LLVNAQQQIEARPVRLGAQNPQGYFVLEGLQGGDKVVTEGLQWIQPGMNVSTRDAQGVSTAQTTQR
ncbi:efflux transporter periplasmic adaptor subunit, partial [Enterobacteriaceae bacterium ML5]